MGINKVKLNSFIEEELNSHTKSVILSTIYEGQKAKKQKDELIFNKYSLEITFLENKVTIYDDIFTEDVPLTISLDDFVVKLLKK